MAIGKVRFVGEPVAAVIAEDELSAQEALEDIAVEYEELTPILDVDTALAPGAAQIHEHGLSRGELSRLRRSVRSRSREISARQCTSSGATWTQAFASAAHIAEGEFYFPMIYAYAMEPYVAIADYDAQGTADRAIRRRSIPFMVRQDLADVFGLPLNNVRVIVPFVGGGYGSKSYTKIEPLVAACSWKIGTPREAAIERRRGVSHHARRRRARAHSHGGRRARQDCGAAGDRFI